MKKDLDHEDVQNLNTNIPVFADAIQSETFESAAKAFEAFDKQEVNDKVESAERTDNTDSKFGETK